MCWCAVKKLLTDTHSLTVVGLDFILDLQAVHCMHQSSLFLTISFKKCPNTVYFDFKSVLSSTLSTSDSAILMFTSDDVPNHVVTQRNGDFGPNRIRPKSNHKSYESNQIPIASRRIES